MLTTQPVGGDAEPAPDAGFLRAAETTPDAQQLLDADIADLGWIMNLTRLWAHQPVLKRQLFDLIGQAAGSGGLSMRQRGILITACASTRRDSYCSLAWGKKLAAEADADLAVGVLVGDDELLDDAERALAAWARSVAGDPNATTADDVAMLRDAGYDDAQILAITVFVALRLAFSTVNGALGAGPDHQLADTAPASVVAAVSFGRPVAAAGV
jgi:alkylhydroperoxidase family enzyme